MLEPSNVPRLARRRRTRRELRLQNSAARPPLPERTPTREAAPLPPRRRAADRSPRFSLRQLFAPRTKAGDLGAAKPRRGPEPLGAMPPLSQTRRARSDAFLRPESPVPAPRLRSDAAPPRSPQRQPRDRRPRAELLSADPLVPASRRRRAQRDLPLLAHLARLLIVGVGVGAIVGTLLAAFAPSTRQMPAAQTEAAPASPSATVSNVASSSLGMMPRPAALQLGEPITPLANTIKSLAAEYEGLTPGIFLADVDTGAYVDLNGTAMFSTASTIKVPILVAFFQDVDAGKIQLSEMLTMRAEDVATGSGEMQYEPVGTRFTALETATEMITTSDNSATNMLIARLGGAEVLNQRFREWGLTGTVIRTPLPDLQGTNTTTPKELSELMARIGQGDLLSLRSRDRLLDIMRRTVTNTLLPAGIEPEATIAHKTGDIGSLVGDVGIVDIPNGKRYVITVMVQRPHNDDRAQELIREISREVYEYLSQPPAAEAAAASAAEQPAN